MFIASKMSLKCLFFNTVILTWVILNMCDTKTIVSFVMRTSRQIKRKASRTLNLMSMCVVISGAELENVRQRILCELWLIFQDN